MSANTLYYNKPQLLANLIDANEMYLVWGRGTGKSEGVLAPRFHRMLTLMPRCSVVNVAESYMQLLDRTLPPMLKRWEEMGMRRGVDIFVRRFPPKIAGTNLPYMTPETAEHSVFLRVNRYDYSVMRLVSQDRPGTSNGMSIDGYGGDEAKFLDVEKLNSELAPTNRGNERYFSHCHLHHGVIFTTDMPTSSSAKWIHQFEEFNDSELDAAIVATELELQKIHITAQKRGGEMGARYTAKEQAAVRYYQKQLFELRRHHVYYSEASTLENIEVLGVDFIKKLKRSLPDFIYRTSVLNERPGKVENTFYPDISDKHFYNAIDYSYIDGVGEKEYGKGKLNNARKDADLDRSSPLEIGIDTGGRINVLVVGQGTSHEFRIINALDVLHPKRIKHLAQALHQYYNPSFPLREAIIYHDHTHVAKNPVSDKNPLDEFVDELDRLGWKVTPYHIGVTPSYRNRYMLWGAFLNPVKSAVDDEPYSILFNKENTKVLRTAMQNTKIAAGGQTGYEKDKKMERDEKADQREAPHYSDAADVLLFGMLKRRRNSKNFGSGLILL